MAPDGMITIVAKMLQEAVAVAVPSDYRRTWRKKSWPVSLELDSGQRVFRVVESRHELAAYELPLSGTWPERVQLDGRAFRHVIETYAPNEMLQLLAYPDRLEIKSNRSPFSMGRLDRPGRKAIKTRPIPRDKRHKGSVKIIDQPFQGRVELDATWDFSARMPVPHHQFPDSQIPSEADPMRQSGPAEKVTDVPRSADGVKKK